ncbi:MAG TPA: transcriptional regulator [Terriglobia bacterium]|nr:transcriptional regulator [Terriglobia bacterium]
MSPNRFYAFRPFRLDSGERVLLRDGEVVPLTPKVAGTLIMLVESAGHLVEKGDLMRRVWPDAFVEEGNLSKNIYTLRKLLGRKDDGREYIETFPKRGYRFTGQVREIREESPKVPSQTERQVGISEVYRLERQASAAPPPESRPIAVPGASESSLALHFGQATRGSARSSVIEMPSRTVDEAPGGTHGSSTAVVTVERSSRRKSAGLAWLLVAIAIAAGTGAYLYVRSRSAPKLTDRDTLVLADFTNTTGDPVFDGTLRQGLAAQLEQTPFLNLLSDTRIAQTLVLMAQPRDARLAPALAREVCLRTASAATLEGSIASLGSQYVLGLKAVNCHNGDLLAVEQATADSKEQVLKALGEEATKLRGKLGESLASVEKYDVPPENVTTPSLEALQAYSLGWRAWNVNGGEVAALPLLLEAVRLDTNFAMAYAALAQFYYQMGETAHAAENAGKAYERRARVSERERFFITSQYEWYVTEDLDAVRKTEELWAHTYPLDPLPLLDLAAIDALRGECDQAVAAEKESLRLDRSRGLTYAALVIASLALDHVGQARAAAQEARTCKVDSPLIHLNLYLADFLQRDAVGMEREAAGLAGKPGWEDLALCYESDTAAYYGQFTKARELTRHAVESAERVDEKEEAVSYEAEAAVREALVGNLGLARRQARLAVTLSGGRDAEAISAIALGLAGDSAEALLLADDLDKRFPKGTLVRYEYLPMIRAASCLGGGNSAQDAGTAVQTLDAAAPYERGDPSPTLDFALYPAYLRGQALLAAHQGAAAAAEFQRIIDQPGIVLNEPIGPLAHLGLARAYAIEAGTPGSAGVPPARGQQQTAGKMPALPGENLAKARAAYRDFFALWKDADPDIPILKQAKAEHAKLR